MKEALTALFRELKPDVAIVVAYGKIIPHEALTVPRFGFVNLHPSLLPKYRGPSPIQTTIANGDAETGVTLMLLDNQIDHGPILAQERVPLSPTATRTQLERELAERGAALLERTLPEYLAGRIAPQPQDDTQATTTPLLTREHGRINWHEPAAVIERKIRAYEWWPGTWTVVSISPLPAGRGSERRRDARIKIISASVGGPTNAPPGSIVHQNNSLAVACGDGRLLTLLTVQPEGRPTMSGVAFLQGRRTLGSLQ
jgi:methionyl-tRNA formyltransferase